MQSQPLSREVLAKKLAEQEALKRHLMVMQSQADAYFWLTEATKTKDEQAEKRKMDPYRPFPKYEYIRNLLMAFEHETETTIYVRKSRTMMGTWTMAGWTAHRMFTRPATTAVVMSVDWSRALKTVEYVKTLWQQSIPELRALWKPLNGMAPEAQAAEKFYLENGSWIQAIPHDPNKIRSQHSTIVLMDEAAHIPQGEENFNVALHSRPVRIIALSSMAPGWFDSKTADAVPVDWQYDAPMEQAA